MAQAAAALEGIKIGGKLVQSLAGAPAEAGGEAMANFISDYFRTHGDPPDVDLILSPYIYPGQAFTAEFEPILRAVGLQYVTIEEGGVVYKYRVRISCSRSMDILFTDGEPDSYRLRCNNIGAHHVDYNSPRPEIHQIVIRYG